MQKEASSVIDTIKGIVHSINECWRLKDYEGIGSYLADEVVVAPPQSEKRIRGRAAYIQSYKDYDQTAKTLKYLSSDPMVDIIEDTAVAVCPFEVIYEFQGAKHHEHGQNILVFRFSQGKWEVVWRTMKVEEIKKKTD